MEAHETNVSQSSFTLGSGEWLSRLRMPGRHCLELVVSGTASGPDLECIAYLNAEVLPRLSVLVETAHRHLDEYVDRQKLFNGASWWLESVRVERGEDSRHKLTLELCIEEDPYGYWTVGFTYLDYWNKFWPSSFTRLQQ
ncbi:hypothetical protein [Comamonas sp. JC664]|uniref:hypothetical protein n=1 Tax=Comamonas sp. JC664 TaxID=2801917 RepID=UPI00174AFE23|nr:hypothetical protein [Comamonas sp. JC664]MBL0698086.1 hypothetical protein [Comamonas sp. JC664]GHG71262.1 hypothetical protein GCM10012319_16900 [Comamonas sp. KCTC 72670]